MGLIKHKQVKMLTVMLMMVVGLCIAMAPATYATPATWTSHAASDEAVSWRGVTWSSELGIFVAVGTNTTGAMTSPDGITWTQQTTPLSGLGPGQIWRGVTWSPELHLFVAVGQPSSTGNTSVMTSPNGIDWTLRTLPVNAVLMGITWAPPQGPIPGQFVATVSPAGGAFTSPDGITWTQQTGPAAGRNVLWADGRYIAMRSSIAGNAYTSANGVTWATNPASFIAWDVAYSTGAMDRYVAVGASGVMVSDGDGVTWNPQTSPVANLRAVEWSPESHQFAAVGDGGIAFSSDGLTWQAATNPTPNSWEAIAWSPELSRFVAVSTNGTNRTMVGLVPTIPRAPLNLTAAPNGAKIRLSWTTPTFDGNSAITGYRIERSVNGGAFSVIVANTASAGTTYDDGSVLAGTTYTYRIYALNAEGQSIASNNASIQASDTLADTGINQYSLIVGALILLIVGSILVQRSPSINNFKLNN